MRLIAMATRGDGFAAWRTARDRLLASPRFRRWSTRFPVTRPIARRRAKALFDLCAGFVYAQVLLACVRLRLFKHLAEGPQPLDALAHRLALPIDSARLLLDAAASLKLVEPRGAKAFGLGPLGAAMVDNPGIEAMVEHHTLLYGDLADPVALLRGLKPETALRHYWAYAREPDPQSLDPDRVAAYSDLMAASQDMIADEVLSAYSLRTHRCLLDVGGGDGTFVVNVASRAPHLRLVLFDLPSVVERARARFARAGLQSRATAIGGNFLTDQLPEGADIVSLVRVIHDHDDATALAILRASRRALPKGGTLLIAEPMGGTPGVESVADAYFAFYLLAMGSGRPRDLAALTKLLAAAGFENPKLVPTHTPMLTRLVTAVAGACV